MSLRTSVYEFLGTNVFSNHFYQCSYCNFCCYHCILLFFTSAHIATLLLLLLFSGTPYYWFPYCINFYAWSAQEIFCGLTYVLILRIFQWCSLSMISTWSHRGQWSPFSLHMWSATPDFFTSPRVTAFWCSWSITLRRRPVSPLHFPLQLHGIAYK